MRASESDQLTETKVSGVSEATGVLEKPLELLQTGVVECVICAGIFYHTRGRKVPTEYSKLCSFFKEVEWNELTDREWEIILVDARRIYIAHRNRQRNKLPK
jgi:hypothetical protein